MKNIFNQLSYSQVYNWNVVGNKCCIMKEIKSNLLGILYWKRYTESEKYEWFK